MSLKKPCYNIDFIKIEITFRNKYLVLINFVWLIKTNKKIRIITLQIIDTLN